MVVVRRRGEEPEQPYEAAETSEDGSLLGPWSEWLDSETMLVYAELRRASDRVSEARAWVEQAAECMAGKQASDPTKLDALLQKGEGLSVVVPSITALREHSERVVNWGRSCQLLLDQATSAKAGTLVGKRITMHDLLRAQKDGAKLCASGTVWENLLSVLSIASESLARVHHGLIHYSTPSQLMSDVHQLEATGIAFEEIALVKMHHSKLHHEHVASNPQQPPQVAASISTLLPGHPSFAPPPGGMAWGPSGGPQPAMAVAQQGNPYAAAAIGHPPPPQPSSAVQSFNSSQFMPSTTLPGNSITEVAAAAAANAAANALGAALSGQSQQQPPPPPPQPQPPPHSPGTSSLIAPRVYPR